MKESSARVTKSALAGLLVVAVLLAGCGSGSGSTPQSTATTTAGNPKPRLRVTRIGSLPRTLSKAAAVGLPHGRLMVLGGYTGAGSLDTILAGPPSRLRVVGRLPQPTHDAAAAAVGGKVYLFGGGESVSMPSVVRVDPRTARGAAATVARLPTGTRYAGVAALGPTIYVAGGLTTAGATSAVYAVSLDGTVRRVATLPAPEDHAALAALGGRLYLVGGRRVLAIDPGSGKVTVAARLPARLADPTATTVGNRIVIAGGGTDGVWTLGPS